MLTLIYWSNLFDSLRDARPTIANNVITKKEMLEQAAITANPASFEETNFNAPLYLQLRLQWITIYYPDIHGNTVPKTQSMEYLWY